MRRATTSGGPTVAARPASGTLPSAGLLQAKRLGSPGQRGGVAEPSKPCQPSGTHPCAAGHGSRGAGGCSGSQYKFHLEDASELADDDAVIERSGAKLVVDEMSLELLRGATVDFEDDMMRSAFVVSENPMSEAACGCGTSFNPKPI